MPEGPEIRRLALRLSRALVGRPLVEVKVDFRTAPNTRRTSPPVSLQRDVLDGRQTTGDDRPRAGGGTEADEKAAKPIALVEELLTALEEREYSLDRPSGPASRSEQPTAPASGRR